MKPSSCVEYAFLPTFEPITRYFDHKYYRAPIDVLSMFRDAGDPDAGLVLAAVFENEDMNTDADAITRYFIDEKGASSDAQFVAVLQSISFLYWTTIFITLFLQPS